ncbi:MAG: LTA synthase family protein, partial [Nitrososphaeraceae archaeon]|nr:LTA synthase family protein [Nitrososphaeraceae archaeon]
ALYRQHPMKKINEYDGLSSALKSHGYTTTYFTTHDSQFDNVEGFLRANDFDNVISQKDYPSEEVKTTLGVPDDFMFSFSIPKINEISNDQKPFFVSFMTASDHGPYYIPDYFKPRSEGIKDQIIEYADWSLKQFMIHAAKQKWYENTLFVFLADHGAPLGSSYDIALNYFHSPFLLYSPDSALIKPKNYIKIANQIDVFPTIMGSLKLPYTNNTLGIDLLHEDRKYSVINDDDKIGILDSSFLCIMKDKGHTLSLYNYRTKDRNDLIDQYPDKAANMAEYAKSLMQVHQYLINKDLTSLQNSKEKLK